MEIKPIKTFTDDKGNWYIEFKSDEVKKALEKFKRKKKKIQWKFWFSKH